MKVAYTKNAKDELIRTDWKTRESILRQIGQLQETKTLTQRLKGVHYDQDLKKIEINNHVIIGKVHDGNFAVISVVQRKEIRLPE